MRIENNAVSVFRGETWTGELIAQGPPERLEVGEGARGAHGMGRGDRHNNRHPTALTATDTVLGVRDREIVAVLGGYCMLTRVFISRVAEANVPRADVKRDNQ